jgi:hypothetical protein
VAQSLLRRTQTQGTNMSDSIHIKPSHKGLLHKDLHISEDKPIPVAELHEKLAAAKRSGNVAEERRLVFAINEHHFHHNKG